MASIKPGQDYSYHDGVLSQLFIAELIWLCSDIKSKAEYIFEKCVVPEDGYMIQISPELHSAIHSIIGMSANIKKLLVTSSRKGDSESRYVYKARQARAQHLSGMLSGIDLEEIMTVKARNSLEHFDEYLDKANAELTLKPVGTRAAYNVIISSWDAFDPKLYPIRLYVSDERKFYNMRTSIDIGKISIACDLILERLRLGRPHGMGDQDGMMITV